MFSNRTEPNKKTDLGRYFCFAFIVAVNLSCLQLLYGKTLVSLYGASAFPFNKDGSWANTNHIGSLIIMAIPLCCYLILEAKSIFFYILEFLFLCVCVHLSKSDGSRAIALCFLPILFFVIYRKISNKNFRAFQLFAKIFIPSVILVIAYLLLFQTDSFISFWIKSSSDSGRIPIYEKALEVFFQFPIFGVGMGHGFVLTGIETHYNGYFHSSFFHAIATMGVMGIIVYTFYYVQRIKMLAKNNTTLGLFAMVSFLMFALYAMIDNGEINIVIIYMTAIVAVVGVYNKKYHEPPLPLSLNRKAIFKK